MNPVQRVEAAGAAYRALTAEMHRSVLAEITDAVVVELNEKAAARAAYDRAVEEARQRALLAGCPAADAPTIVPPPRLSEWDQAEGE